MEKKSDVKVSCEMEWSVQCKKRLKLKGQFIKFLESMLEENVVCLAEIDFWR